MTSYADKMQCSVSAIRNCDYFFQYFDMCIDKSNHAVLFEKSYRYTDTSQAHDIEDTHIYITHVPYHCRGAGPFFSTNQNITNDTLIIGKLGISGT